MQPLAPSCSLATFLEQVIAAIRAMTGSQDVALADVEYLAPLSGDGARVIVEEDSFRVETRSGIQAVIVRRHPLHFVLRWLAPGRAQQRLVISVDQHGKVTALAAEPVRW